MPIRVTCDCGNQLFLHDSLAGRLITCMKCRQPLLVPDPAQALPVAIEDDRPTPESQELPDSSLLEPFEEDQGALSAKDQPNVGLMSRFKAPSAAEDRPATGELACMRVKPADAPVSVVAASPDNLHALAVVEDTVFVLDLAEKRIARAFKEHDCRVRCAAISVDGKRALSGDERGGLVVWEVANARALQWLEGHERRVEGAAFAPDGRLALSGGSDGMVLLWDLSQGRELACLDESRRGILRVAFAPDGRRALSGDSESRVCMWEVATGRLLWDLPGPDLGPITHLAFSPGGDRALAAGSRRERKGPPPIGQWEVASGRRLRTDYESAARGKTTVTCVAFAPDGNHALTAGGPVGVPEGRSRQFWYTPVHLWDINRGVTQKTFRGHLKWKRTQYEIARFIERDRGGIVTDRNNLDPYRFPLATVHCVAFAPDGRRALSGANDGTVRIWGL
jgi:WD40 repeat protein